MKGAYMELKVNKDGQVDYAYRAGKDIVTGHMTAASAKRTIDQGEVVKSDLKGYQICVDGEWYFKGKA